MAELIDRQALIKRLKEWDTPDVTDKALYNFALNRALEMPTIATEQKHGTWGENIYGYRKCSVCGRVTQVDECMREPLYLYCPYCGARMDEVDNGK